MFRDFFDQDQKNSLKVSSKSFSDNFQMNEPIKNFKQNFSREFFLSGPKNRRKKMTFQGRKNEKYGTKTISDNRFILYFDDKKGPIKSYCRRKKLKI